jgi:orotidine-5'-phosphate decarboxylase
MVPSVSEPRVIVACDFATASAALSFLDRVDPARCRVKIGKELFTAAGPQLVRAARERGFGVFLDLKFHDIPNTVAGACAAAADLGVWMMNVHASGGPRMLEAARKAVPKGGALLIGVTVLTSMEAAELEAVGVSAVTTLQQVQRLATLVAAAGLDGVVCSAREAPELRAQFGAAFTLVTPGIRASGAPADDQRRTATPAQAIRDGASYLVVGRPVTQAADPLSALLEIEREISAAAATPLP